MSTGPDGQLVGLDRFFPLLSSPKLYGVIQILGLHGETMRMYEPPSILMEVSTASLVWLGVSLPPLD